MNPMSRPVLDDAHDPVIVLIPDDIEGSMDEWLASLPRDEPPIEPPSPASELIAEVRRESE